MEEENLLRIEKTQHNYNYHTQGDKSRYVNCNQKKNTKIKEHSENQKELLEFTKQKQK